MTADPVPIYQPPPAQQTFVNAVSLGARLGLKWTTYIVGPICVFIFVVFAGLWSLRFWFRDGFEIFNKPAIRWKMVSELLSPFGAFLVTCAWGVVVAELVTFPLYLVNRLRRRSGKTE